ncbi:hypothetical protein [Kouleothrix sp.]|uniref:hypothetical protein n=1 Tax=Kouleothrix sp. TaxID=2779161 RepID=UPI00391A0940
MRTGACAARPCTMAASRMLATLHHDLPQGAVRLVDLGYFDLALLAELDARGVSWFSRMQALTSLQTDDGRWWRLHDLLAAMPEATLDLPVRLGREAQVRARLLAVRHRRRWSTSAAAACGRKPKRRARWSARCAWPWRRGACL